MQIFRKKNQLIQIFFFQMIFFLILACPTQKVQNSLIARKWSTGFLCRNPRQIKVIKGRKHFCSLGLISFLQQQCWEEIFHQNSFLITAFTYYFAGRGILHHVMSHTEVLDKNIQKKKRIWQFNFYLAFTNVCRALQTSQKILKYFIFNT